MASWPAADALSYALHRLSSRGHARRLVSVMCLGWDSGDPFYKPNQYDNPFQCQTALFKTDRGNAFRVCVFWYSAHRGTERGQ